ncbi:hypothetical protein BpHYR1_015140 [Brachionus plicatilis]|uniref:Uncharacterized protein n=1 Tax=Brachionus plicatilis TaxID=10195 RepID=A0A3M7T6E7_BRAPC|nr:hypothetical protein BpHYR1_015140 [Brachionus plicatilis]
MKKNNYFKDLISDFDLFRGELLKNSRFNFKIFILKNECHAQKCTNKEKIKHKIKQIFFFLIDL